MVAFARASHSAHMEFACQEIWREGVHAETCQCGNFKAWASDLCISRKRTMLSSCNFLLCLSFWLTGVTILTKMRLDLVAMVRSDTLRIGAVFFRPFWKFLESSRCSVSCIVPVPTAGVYFVLYFGCSKCAVPKVFIGRDRNMRDRLVAIKKAGCTSWPRAERSVWSARWLSLKTRRKRRFCRRPKLWRTGQTTGLCLEILMEGRCFHWHFFLHWAWSGVGLLALVCPGAGFGPPQYLQAFGDLRTGPFLVPKRYCTSVLASSEECFSLLRSTK